MEKISPQQQLGNAKLGRLMLKFSVPCVLSLLISALYNIVDQIFIGNSELSALGNAATGVVFPVFIVAQAFAWCLGDGCAAFINIFQGKGETQKLDRSVGGCITVTLGCSVALIALFFPLKNQILNLCGASQNSIGYAVTYFNIVVAFFPVYMLSNMLNSVVRADGNPAWAMASMLAGALINIALDPLFIFTFKMGMAGAAWATVIGQAASFIIGAAYLFRTRTFKLKLSRRQAWNIYVYNPIDYRRNRPFKQLYAQKIRRAVGLRAGYSHCHYRNRKQSFRHYRKCGGGHNFRLPTYR